MNLQSCQLSRILRETHAFTPNLTLTRIITSISRAVYYVCKHIIYSLAGQTLTRGVCPARLHNLHLASNPDLKFRTLSRSSEYSSCETKSGTENLGIPGLHSTWSGTESELGNQRPRATSDRDADGRQCRRA